ncbi:MAG: ABC transporter permease [Truepera sp.]|nr:ABC transporter permease [Truepera sp.]
MVVVRDLFRFSPSFRIGGIILVLVLVLVILSFFSPHDAYRRRVVPTNQPPSTEHILGTNSQGQDVFWQLTFATRNTLLVAVLAIAIGRTIAILLGSFSGYVGGTVDRVLSSIVDSFIVLPRLPLLILIAAILRGEMTLLGLGFLLGLLDWAHPSKRYRSQILTLREREFTHTGSFSGMSVMKIIIREHIPFLIPFMLVDVVSGFLWAIGMEVTLAVLGLADLTTPSIGTGIYWANYHNALLANRIWILAAPVAASIIIVVGFYLVSIALSRFLDPRTRLERLGAGS